MTEKTINYIKLPDGETYKIGGSGSGFNLFDTKVSDHVLEGEEALGWALQGTYVTKTDYPDAYNRILNKYNDPNNTISVLQQNYVVNGTLTESTKGSTGFSTSTYAYYNWGSPSTSTLNFITEFTPTTITEGVVLGARAGVYIGLTSDGYIYFSLNMTDSTVATATGTVKLTANVNYKAIFERTSTGFKLSVYNGETLTDSISYTQDSTVAINETHGMFAYGVSMTNGTIASPFNGYILLTKSSLQMGSVKRDMTVNCYQNTNKIRIYDTTYKALIDTIYETTGKAWYYGIDLANERIFLPRDKYFAVTGDVAVKGNGMTLGLTNGSTYAGLTMRADGDANYSSVRLTTSAYGSKISTTPQNASTGIGGIYGITTDSTKSGIEGQLTPDETKYLYICVGNTKVESAITNVTEITTSENDTLPLFYNFYSKEDMTTTGAYVNASLASWLSGNVYTTAYNELVNKLGTDNVKANTDTYTDYDFVVNQDDMTFRLPIKNGQEIMFATGVKGNGMTLGLTTGNKKFGLMETYNQSVNNVFANSNAYGVDVGKFSPASWDSETDQALGVTTDSTKSGIELDTENITIPDGWNLYYKLSNAVTNLELLDVGKVTADLNTKISRTECKAFIVETYQNGDSWYRVWSDGWCEQGGRLTLSTFSYTFLKSYPSVPNVTVQVWSNSATGASNEGAWMLNASPSTTKFTISGAFTSTYFQGGHWQACGYIA